MGYTRFQKWDEGVSWRRRDAFLVLVQARQELLSSSSYPGGAGLNHLAFQARSRRQVDDITRELQRRGVNVLYDPDHRQANGGNGYAVFFEDPDHLKIEVVAPD